MAVLLVWSIPWNSWHGLVGWCLMPMIAELQLYHGVNKLHQLISQILPWNVLNISLYFNKSKIILKKLVRVRIMVINAAFNNIAVISWRSVLLVEEPKECSKNQSSAARHWQTLSHSLYQDTSTWARFELTKLVVTGTDCIRSKSNHHTIRTTSKWVGHYPILQQW